MSRHGLAIVYALLVVQKCLGQCRFPGNEDSEIDSSDEAHLLQSKADIEALKAPKASDFVSKGTNVGNNGRKSQISVKGKKGGDRSPDQVPSKILELYLDHVRDTLTGTILGTTGVRPSTGNAQSIQRIPFDSATRWAGRDWCDFCYTMAGGARVQNVRELVQKTIQDSIPGDFLEAGTWRGGCSIMARVVQQAMQEGTKRRTYLCDSYSGLPKSSTSADTNDWADMKFLEVAQSDVEENFRKFGMLDDHVKFRKGYFSESLPKVRKELQDSGRKLAVLRGDGDMYESFMDILYNLYEFIPVGGYFICDDCPGIAVAQQAIDEFRQAHRISDQIYQVNGSLPGTYWRKGAATAVNYTRYLEWNATRVFQKKD